MNIKLGEDKMLSSDEARESARKDAMATSQNGSVVVHAPWRNLWDPSKDFNFMVTSYQAGVEKPNPAIFVRALQFARYMALSRGLQDLPTPTSAIGGVASIMSSTFRHRNDVDNMTWIHIGDDYEKDYVGAESVDFEALHLVREGQETKSRGANSISSLTEVASVMNLLLERM
jgi:hypothetical protein